MRNFLFSYENGNRMKEQETRNTDRDLEKNWEVFLLEIKVCGSELNNIMKASDRNKNWL